MTSRKRKEEAHHLCVCNVILEYFECLKNAETCCHRVRCGDSRNNVARHLCDLLMACQGRRIYRCPLTFGVEL